MQGKGRGASPRHDDTLKHQTQIQEPNTNTAASNNKKLVPQKFSASR
jgi:hypothetical protein